MIALKQREPLLQAQRRGDVEPALKRVSHRANFEAPKPYVRWCERQAILVCANTFRTEALEIRLDIDASLFAAGARAFEVTDIWNDGPPALVAAGELNDYRLRIGPDGTPRGGVGLLKVDAVD